MVLLLLTSCLLLLPLWESVIVLCFVVRYFMSILIAIILMGKRELIVLLNLSSWCLVMVEWLFLAVPRGCLQFVIVVFPDHTHVLFMTENEKRKEGDELMTCFVMHVGQLSLHIFRNSCLSFTTHLQI